MSPEHFPSDSFDRIPTQNPTPKIVIIIPKFLHWQVYYYRDFNKTKYSYESVAAFVKGLNLTKGFVWFEKLWITGAKGMVNPTSEVFGGSKTIPL